MESSSLRIDPHVEDCRNKKSLVGICQVLGRDNVKSVLERPTIIEVHWYEIVWQWRKILLREIMDCHIMLSPCVLLIDSFNLIVSQPTKCSPEDPLKIKWEEGIYHATMDLEYTYILLTSCWSDRILYQLMWKTAVSHRLMDLQNYPRNRKSNRIHQPEALDSKTCPNFPVTWMDLFLMNRDYLLKFSISIFFCVPKVLIEKPAHTDQSLTWSEKITHHDGRQWVPGQGTGNDSELPAFWKLPLVDITWTDGGRPGPGSSSYSLRLCPLYSNLPTFKSRLVPESRRRQAAHITCQLEAWGFSQLGDGLSWDANPDPGGGQHGLRRGWSGTGAVDPSSRAR